MFKSFLKRKIASKGFSLTKLSGIYSQNLKREGKLVHFIEKPQSVESECHLGHLYEKVIVDVKMRQVLLEDKRVKREISFNDKNQALIDQFNSKRAKLKHIEQLYMDFDEDKIAEIDSSSTSEHHIQRNIVNHLDSYAKMNILADYSNIKTTSAKQSQVGIYKKFREMLTTQSVAFGEDLVVWSEKLRKEVDYEVVMRPKENLIFSLPVRNSSEKLNLAMFLDSPWKYVGITAVCVNPSGRYAVFKIGDQLIVSIESRMAEIARRLGEESVSRVSTLNLEEILDFEVFDPIFNRKIPVIKDEKVPLHFGSGLMPLVPGHDTASFSIAEENKIPIKGFLDGNCCGIRELGFLYSGKHYSEIDRLIPKRLKGAKCLSALFTTETPMYCSADDMDELVVRTVNQFYFRENRLNLLSNALKTELKPQLNFDSKANWFEKAAEKHRIPISQVGNFGLPIPLFYSKGKAVFSLEILDHFIETVSQKGSDCWFDSEPEDLLPSALKEVQGGITKGNLLFNKSFVDILLSETDGDPDFISKIDKNKELGSLQTNEYPLEEPLKKVKTQFNPNNLNSHSRFIVEQEEFPLIKSKSDKLFKNDCLTACVTSDAAFASSSLTKCSLEGKMFADEILLMPELLDANLNKISLQNRNLMPATDCILGTLKENGERNKGYGCDTLRMYFASRFTYDQPAVFEADVDLALKEFNFLKKFFFFVRKFDCSEAENWDYPSLNGFEKVVFAKFLELLDSLSEGEPRKMYESLDFFVRKVLVDLCLPVYLSSNKQLKQISTGFFNFLLLETIKILSIFCPELAATEFEQRREGPVELSSLVTLPILESKYSYEHIEELDTAAHILFDLKQHVQKTVKEKVKGKGKVLVRFKLSPTERKLLNSLNPTLSVFFGVDTVYIGRHVSEEDYKLISASTFAKNSFSFPYWVHKTKFKPREQRLSEFKESLI